MYLCNMFFLIDTVDIASYADDNTPSIIGKKLYKVEKKIEIALAKLFKWFRENGMKANQE